MKLRKSTRSSSRGFTLLELTVALFMAMGIAGTLLGLLQQQISFTRVLNEFGFLRDEAPQVNTLLTNIINKADLYRIYPDLESAKNQTGAVRTGGKTIRLRFRHPDGTEDFALVSFDVIDGEKQLNYYFRDKSASAWPSSPSWTITSEPDAVTFDNSTGILLVTMTGARGEEITYAGNPD